MSGLLSSLLVILLVSLPAQLQAEPATLTVAAASDLTDLEPALAAAFHKNEPRWEVKWVTAASGVLRQQIENGAPYDAFLSANADYVDRLASNGKLVPASVVAYAEGRVGMLWRDHKDHDVKDLAQNWVRIVALPNPKLAPYGIAAQQALEHAGVWQAVRPKLVYGENVRQTLELFQSGNADAVLTSGSLLAGKKAQVLPLNSYDPIVQKAGVVAASSQKKVAATFVRFLTGPDAQLVFARFGFSGLRVSLIVNGH